MAIEPRRGPFPESETRSTAWIPLIWQNWNLSTRPPCPNCGLPLSGNVMEHQTTCLNCGHVWRLSENLVEVMT
jgi:hypothetical protein